MKLFVSAVTKGLGTYRQAVADYLWQRDIEPIEQKKFGIKSKQLEHLLKDLIRSCDGVVCLIGPSFGYAPSDNPSRSYTQYEYLIANELQKEIFLFFAADDCPLDALRPDQQPDTAEQQESQRQFCQWIETHDKRIRYSFHNRDELLRQTADAVFDLRRSGASAAQPGIRVAVEKAYPTPVAEMYERIGGNAQQLYLLSEDLLRFTGLLAMHDAVRCGSAGGISAEDVITPALCDDSPGRQIEWAALLGAACAAAVDDEDRRMIPELVGWNRRHRSTIETLLAACADIVKLQFRDRKLEAQRKSLVESVTALIDGLSFLQNYLLVEISANAAEGGGDSVHCSVFRGIHPHALQLTGTATAGLYLLDLDRRSAHALAPVLFAELKAHGRGIYGWSVLESDGANGRLIVTPFGDISPPDFTRELRSSDSGIVIAPDPNHSGEPGIPWPTCWTIPGIAESLPPGSDFRNSAAEPEPTLDDDAWQALEVLAFPERDPRRFLGGRFLVLPPALHAGKHADIIPAVEHEASEPSVSETVTEQFVVHQLRDDFLGDVAVREWFFQRTERWQTLNHAFVLRVENGSNAASEAKHPFFAVRQLAGRDLESLLEDGHWFGDREILQIVCAAAEICQVAHAQGLRLLTLPPRHFLFDESGRVWLTGFDTLLPADIVRQKPYGWLDQFVHRFSRDGSLVAPEAGHQRRQLDPSVDVYAVGMLLARLKGMACHARDWLPLDKWSDPWECFAFHCLAAQPAMRFQSATQLLTYLEQLSNGWTDPTPRLVTAARAANTAGDLLFGHYPITNREFQAYCADRGLPLPWHLRELDHEDSLYNRRLAGPWFPVAFVDLREAESYCGWLSSRLRRTVRIPDEREWLQAAGERRFPWGDSSPDPMHANYDRYYRGPTVVGAFEHQGSASGCADLAGNVWEWCTDRVFDGTPRRVLKGGAYDFAGDSLCNSSRWPVLVRHRSGHVGFRIVVEEG